MLRRTVDLLAPLMLPVNSDALGGDAQVVSERSRSMNQAPTDHGSGQLRGLLGMPITESVFGPANRGNFPPQP